MADIGILGGTFDPIHLGHTEPAKVVADYLSLDKVLLIPANIPPHKATPNVSAKQRAEMVTLACADEKRFYCDQRELNRTGNSYTVDTLKTLKQSYPKQRLFFIIGLDSLLTFTRWHKYQEILSLCHLVVNSRPNYQLACFNQDTELLLANHQANTLAALNEKDSGGIIFVPSTVEDFNLNKGSKPLSCIKQKINLDISSTDIRARLANNQSCKHLLADKVLAFINKNQLYR
ncbi:MAG: nicotinate-nucleotide adenylyltransferase [Colwellia sp.]|nr:nicotinate-nucleotide adenylyltransferase [Colwellia sp.]MCW8866011.1 nicotinate-nucleotide adenylyltransferase [Colwellia sp.]MCW9081658.1 nicotinate-nucleotide adenylyltransferase [Colwellia sp.]